MHKYDPNSPSSATSPLSTVINHPILDPISTLNPNIRNLILTNEEHIVPNTLVNVNRIIDVKNFQSSII